ncbi:MULTISPECIES: ABC transporter ATP-binding protein [Rhizobium]|uniref:ABC transporter ATP-binding protein n=1 Tax=Rhizobium TaxID=379 RepID=UPI0007EC2316|nr:MULTISPECIES: sn-glycerol-3-phosphate ABC transporter ATP-binding protein UgpC [Rhizobium]ANK95292.1 sugar ABC transporter ATP-binding protein [Rhizobium sp. N6212]ANL01345.1 sugar ABC transporter ATP-binding protein [Rhizobium sp. N621]ANL07468.1 sugar ABC transporter ATP-binding protein [Rhizobium esperanzae]ANL13638.1 sugar ABC transporter ATP-binding protein [Rhizobium sp. N1341]ANL25622.1 sugar ABC transporter ATP-binding protein [Rhizobium sp. N113]
MASISLKELNKSYGALTVVHDIDLEIADKEFIILVGPSGCGKSTTLRMIAGLEEISGGELRIGGDVMNDVPSKDRDIAMVFQNYALYPHMTVYKNMAFGLQLRKVSRDFIDKQVQDAAKILDITHLLNRKPKALSGGQRQRVALGRAMVRNPAVFLLDEPLSNLDAKLRGTMRSEITKLHKRLDATFIYVTHDQVEAMTMADRIVVMKDGHIQQVDTPQNLYDRPVNMFVAGFIGAPQMNMLPSTIQRRGAGFIAVFDGRELPLPDHFDKGRIAPYEGRELVLGIRPENFHELPPADIPPENLAPLKAVVELAEPMGSEVHLNMVAGGRNLIARVSPRFRPAIGDAATLVADMSNAQLFDKETERSILY